MSGSPFSDILTRSRDAAGPPVEAEDEAAEFPCYAKLRGPRQVAFMLELRFANADGEAFDYGLLGRIQFNPSTGLVLHFVNGQVGIRGRNLRPLFEGILRHQVTWVAVPADPAAAARDPEATVVTGIAVETV